MEPRLSPPSPPRVLAHPAPEPTGALETPYPRWWLVLAVWAAWGLVLSTQVHIYTRMGPKPVTFFMSLRLNMPGALIWALFTPGIIWFSRRYPPFEGRHWPRHLAFNFAASALAVALEVLVMTLNARLIRGASPEDGPLLLDVARTFVWWFASDSLLYWAVVATDYGVRHYRELKDRELRASQLEAQLAAARLEALKLQLQPHFLFNALHTIGQLVRTGQDATAVAVVAGLGDLLRRLLDGAAAQEVPLRQELEFIQSYLEIEQIRFRDRLDARIDVPEDALDARVPHLILQPLVENAIRYGIAPRPRGGHVDVSAWRVGDRLHLAVWDDGAALADATNARNGSEAADDDAGRGLGLANTSARVRELYGDAGSFEMVDRPEGGVVAHVVIPFQLAAAEWQGASSIP